MKELIIEAPRVSFSVNGKTFYFTPDSEFAIRLSELASEASRRAELCHRLCIFDGSEAKEFLCLAIDSLIGDGTVEDIFGDTDPDVMDLCDVLGIISSAFHEYRMMRLERIREGRI